ncbi:MAG: RNA-binding S4 domain-containing protein [Oscillospiraceae bacterium]|nr:RNA-binding S4 domain-containing protein [Oscillospiraceae bacterium]MBQ3049000.1 RNA-binding S4 domain-containing protein [Oscillospiraceae bacterium]MBQ9938834.1 RNA-binding S4 domain-containing protein [Oscillospiraceae bacterium]
MEVKIYTEFIKLDSFMKLASAVMSGGEAKELILAGKVKVNGETCLMRGKKLYPGYTVNIEGDGEEYLVAAEEK